MGRKCRFKHPVEAEDMEVYRTGNENSEISGKTENQDQRKYSKRHEQRVKHNQRPDKEDHRRQRNDDRQEYRWRKNAASNIPYLIGTLRHGIS